MARKVVSYYRKAVFPQTFSAVAFGYESRMESQVKIRLQVTFFHDEEIINSITDRIPLILAFY